MSIFRPPKTKPRQFNYIPRYYDPVKEERNHRRKLLHGTSTESDNEEYTPGKYVRTQREARDAVRESERSAGGSKLMSLMLITAAIAVGIMWLMPYIMEFIMAADQEKKAAMNGTTAQAANVTSEQSAEQQGMLEFIVTESIDIENMEGIETLNDEIIEELKQSEWRNKTITIVDND